MYRHETDIIEHENGKTIVIEKSIVKDKDGNVIKSETDMFEIKK